MSERILIIEDDSNINNLVRDILVKAGYSCDQAYSGTEGLLLIKMNKYSLIILDLMLPGLTGEELLRKIRSDNQTPVIVLSAKDELDSKVDLLNFGAEDYITKPFHNKELVARVAVQIRQKSKKINNTILKYKELSLDKERYIVAIDDKDISLTKQEMKIFELLLSYPTKVFSKQDIYNYAWEDYYMGEDKTINVHISNIRQKLKTVTDNEYIETVWGIGFRLHK